MPADRPVSPSRVLVVDDDAAVCEQVATTLSAVGFEVRQAADGTQALIEFEDMPPAVVLLDIGLPGLDGFQTCRHLRTLRGGRETPIVFLAAPEDRMDDHAVSHGGADDLLAKPIGRTELVLRVRSLAALRAQRDELLAVARRRHTQIAHIVHDLRAPLSSVHANLQYLLRDPDISNNARGAARDALDAVDMAARMTADLLDVHLSEDGVLVPRLQEVDLRRLLEDLRRQGIRRASGDVSQTVTVSTRLDHKSILADRLLLRRVLENLLDNAMRYAPPSTTIHLEARSFSDGLVELRVRDEGPGVPESCRELVFEPFAQLVAEKDRNVRTGRGLGLAFCRAAVEAHGGRIWVEDNEPAGACFCVRLPVALTPRQVVGSVQA